MGKHAVVVIGPAGSGKSTFCKVLAEHYGVLGRSVHVCNFDPAAEDLFYEPSIDIRELISLEDAMEGKGLGPNGGLVFCMEYLTENITWLHDQLEDYSDDFLIIDMPGQIELFSHVPVIPLFVQVLQQQGYFVTISFLLDALTATADAGKFVAGCLATLAAMTSFECPFLNILSKCDLLTPEFKSQHLEHYCSCDFDFLKTGSLPPKWREMTRRIATVVDDFSLVRFIPLDITDTDSVGHLSQVLDGTLQVADDAEVRDADFEEGDDGRRETEADE